jgi:hypothetical protein
MIRLVGGVAFAFLLAATAGGAEGAFETESSQLRQRYSAENTKALIQEWEALTSRHVGQERIVEAQYYLAQLYKDEDKGRYLPFVKQVVEAYSGPKNHYHYLLLLTTYGQVMAKEDEKERVFRGILDQLDAGVMLPSKAWGITDPGQATSLLRTGAVWAELQEKTRKLPDIHERARAAYTLAKDLESRMDQGASAACDYEWIRQDATRFVPAPGQNRPNDNRGISGQPLPPNGHVAYAADIPVFVRDSQDGKAESFSADKNQQVIRWVGYCFIGLGIAIIAAGLIVRRSTREVGSGQQ